MRLQALLILVVLSACLPVADAAASGGDVIEDCTQHGTLTKHYSQREYRQALGSLPADVDEYGDCRNIIKDAEVAGAATSGSGKKGSGAGAAPESFNQPPSGPTASGPSTVTSGSGHERASAGTSTGGDDPTAIDPGDGHAGNPTNTDENAALIDATRNGGGAVKVGNDAIAPGAQNSSFTESLPTPVLGVLALHGMAALAVGALALRRRLRGDGDGDGDG